MVSPTVPRLQSDTQLFTRLQSPCHAHEGLLYNTVLHRGPQ